MVDGLPSSQDDSSTFRPDGKFIIEPPNWLLPPDFHLMVAAESRPKQVDSSATSERKCRNPQSPDTNDCYFNLTNG
jgi:hypothetical protein